MRSIEISFKGSARKDHWFLSNILLIEISHKLINSTPPVHYCQNSYSQFYRKLYSILVFEHVIHSSVYMFFNSFLQAGKFGALRYLLENYSAFFFAIYMLKIFYRQFLFSCFQNLQKIISVSVSDMRMAKIRF